MSRRTAAATAARRDETISTDAQQWPWERSSQGPQCRLPEPGPDWRTQQGGKPGPRYSEPAAMLAEGEEVEAGSPWRTGVMNLQPQPRPHALADDAGEIDRK